MLWTKTGTATGLPIASARQVGLLEDQAPTVKLARFFARKAVAEDQGKPPYFYCDQNIDPPAP